jgi:hypothetical protein
MNIPKRVALLAKTAAAIGIAIACMGAIYTDNLTFTGTETNNKASTTSTPANPSAITSPAIEMLGLAGAIDPIVTGRVYLSVTGVVNNNVSGASANMQCRYGTGAAPANAAAATGTQIGATLNFLSASSTTEKVPFTCAGVVTGLALGTQIWIDLGVDETSGADNVTITAPTVAAFEF